MKKLEYLLTLQASFMLLALKAKNYHWNVSGEHFFETHEELDTFFDGCQEQMDAVAEKVVMFDGLALGSYSEASKASLVKEVKAKNFTSKDAFVELSKDLEKLLDFVSKLKSIDFRVQPVLDEVVLFCHEWVWKFKKASK